MVKVLLAFLLALLSIWMATGMVRTYVLPSLGSCERNPWRTRSRGHEKFGFTLSQPISYVCRLSLEIAASFLTASGIFGHRALSRIFGARTGGKLDGHVPCFCLAPSTPPWVSRWVMLHSPKDRARGDPCGGLVSPPHWLTARCTLGVSQFPFPTGPVSVDTGGSPSTPQLITIAI